MVVTVDLGGILAVRAMLHPLSTMKTRLQVQDGQHVTSLWATFRKTISTEGVRGFYRGFGVAMLGVLPAQTLYISTLEGSRIAYGDLLNSANVYLRENHKKDRNNDSNSIHPESYQISPSLKTTVIGFMSGASASCASAVFGVPADIISQRQMVGTRQIQETAAARRKETMSLIKDIYRTNGIRGFYRGYLVTIVTYAPSSAIWWATYSSTRRLLSPWAGDDPFRNILLPPLCGVASAVTAATLTNPLDVAKTRLQLARNGKLTGSPSNPSLTNSSSTPVEVKPPTTISGIWRDIYAREGLFRLWTKGLSARIFNMSLFAVSMSSAYELIKYLSRKKL